MLKGFLIIFISGYVVFFGLSKVYKMSKRCVLLKSITDAFSYISDYVNLYRVSQREVFEKISKMPCYKELDIFPLLLSENQDEDIYSCYLKALEKSNLKNFLLKEDFEYMDNFFRESSMYDLELYLKNCNNLSSEYHNLYKKANEEKNQKEKLFTSLSILAGLFVIVILI